MKTSSLQRTIRRCIAVLLLPISLYPMMFVARMDDDGISYTHPALDLGYEVALSVFIGAALYLLGSVVFQILSSIEDNKQEEPTSD